MSVLSYANQLQRQAEYFARRAPRPVKKVPAFGLESRQSRTWTGNPPRVFPTAPGKQRKYPYTASFRYHFDRDRLPVKINYTTKYPTVDWTIPIHKVEWCHVVPIFFEGLREHKYPYHFVAVQAIHFLIDKISLIYLTKLLPRLIVPLKGALATGRPDVICDTLVVIQHMVNTSSEIGKAMVPHYDHMLMYLDMYKDWGNASFKAGEIDYGQRMRRNIADLVQETLRVLAGNGGVEALDKIRHNVPTFELIPPCCKRSSATRDKLV